MMIHEIVSRGPAAALAQTKDTPPNAIPPTKRKRPELDVRPCRERAPVLRARAVRLDGAGVVGGVMYPTCDENPYRGYRASRRRIRRSRVTLATIDAAAMAALFVSPSTTAVCGGASGPSRKPSTRQASAGGWSSASTCPEPQRFDRCRPVRSMSAEGMTRTAMRDAAASTAW